MVEKDHEGKMVKVHKLRDLLDLEPEKPSPPKLDAFVQSRWSHVKRIPSSKKKAEEPS